MSYATPPVPGGPDNLNAPLYGATIGQAFTRFWKKYATFSGRASRSEYWWWFLISFVISAILGGISGGTASGYNPADPTTMINLYTGPAGIISTIWGLATLVPGLALVWRRLHDTNRSGGWFFIVLVPLVGWIILLVFLVMGPKPEGARFDRA